MTADKSRRLPLDIGEPDGVLIVDKHAGVTSHDIVGKVRRLYGTKKVGHTGTLDPMATGVLVVLIGRAAKASEYLTYDRKRYLATLRLGITTDTEDTSGTVLTQTDCIPDFSALEAVLPEFRGTVMQIPPMYSALKQDGQKLVDLARRGITVERQAREIRIFRLDAAQTDSSADFALDVTCSGGTYIRTLCADIGARLGCGGVMASLRRMSVGHFMLSQAHTVDELEAMSPAERRTLLIPTEQLFSDLPALRLVAFHEKLIRSGCAVAQKKLKTDLAPGARVRLCNEAGAFFALGEAVEDTEQGSAVKAIKTFAL